MTQNIVPLDAVREERSAFEGMRVLAAVSSESAKASLASVFGELDGADCGFAPDAMSPADAIAACELAPHAFFFEARSDEAASAILKDLRNGAGGLAHLIVLVPYLTRTGTLALIREGADDVLTNRPDQDDVIRALARAATSIGEAPEKAGGDSGDGQTRTLAFLHASGGAGATTIAVNTAIMLAQRLKTGEGRVCYIDLDLQFGDADFHLDLPMRSRVLEIVKTPERLDERMLEELMVDGPKDIRVLTAPEGLMPFDALSPESVARILALARRRYRYVVVDFPAALVNWTEAALAKCDHAFLATQATVPALRSAGRLLGALRDEGALASPLTPLINRYGGKGSSPRITLEQCAAALGESARFSLPSDYALMSECADQGVPAAVLRPSAKFCEQLSRALDAVVEHRAERQPAAALAARQFLKFGR